MKEKIYRVYIDGIEGEYTKGYIKLTAEQLKDLDCRDSDYEYEEVVISKDLGYLMLYKEVVKNNIERLKQETENEQWLKDNPKEVERIEKKNGKRKQLLKKADGDIRKTMELNRRFIAEDIEEGMFENYLN